MRISDWSSDVCSSDLLVGNAREQVGPGRDLVVVAHAGAPLVDVDIGVVDFLLVEGAEQVEIRMHGHRAVDRPAVGIDVDVAVGGGVAALDIVVGNVVGGRRSRGHGKGRHRQQRGGNTGVLHSGDPYFESLSVKGRPGVGGGRETVGETGNDT